MYTFLKFASILLCVTSSTGFITDNPRPLYFTLMVSGAAGLNTSGIVPAVERALQDINSDPTILPGYSLNYTRVADTKVVF